MKDKKIDYTKKILKGFVPIINKEIKQIWQKERENINFPKESVNKISRHVLDHAEEHNTRPAKRLRAAFIYYGYKLLGGKEEKEILYAATSIEFVHTGLLMHDDFMDNDTIRRGKPTTHEYYKIYHKDNLFYGNSTHYGAGMAVVLGDIALTLGYKVLSKSEFSWDNKAKALSYLFDGIIKTGYGQIYDITLESGQNGGEDEIINLHHAKTSIYTYQTPLNIGAILANGKKEDIKIISEYAVPGGIAFQLQDDVLGLFGDSAKTGKSAFADVREGKKTVLITKALELGTNAQVKKIMEVWGNPNIKPKDAQDIRDIVKETGSLKYSQDLAMKYARSSQKVLPNMKKNGWDKDVIEFLDGIAEYMANGRDM